MEQPTHNRPRIFSLAAISIATLATHWMALINEGLVAEDWGLFPALLYKDWTSITDLLASTGMPVFSLYAWPMTLVVNVFLYKAIFFLAIYFIAVLAYLIGVRSGYLTDREALMVAIFSQLLPIATITTVFSYAMYFNAYVLFLWASYLFVGLETTRGIRHFTMRGVSLGLYFLAFSLNSLLVLYGGAFVLVYLVRLRMGGRQVRHLREVLDTFIGFCKTRIDFMLFPFLYWAWKRIFTPRSGQYSNYNTLEFVPGRIAMDAYHFVADGFVIPLAKSFGPTNPYMLLAAAIYVALFVWMVLKFSARTNRPSDTERVEGRSAWAMVGFGFLLFLGGAAPYILVGKSPEPGVLMRNAMLIPLPLSVMLVGTWRVLKSKLVGIVTDNAATVALLILLVPFTVRWWDNYAAWQARTAKDIAITQYLAENPQWANFSVYWIEDKFPLKGSDDEHGFQEYTARFRMLWGGQTRMAFTPPHEAFFGIDSPRGVRPVHSKFPERLSYFCSNWSSSRNIDLTGPQAELGIAPGPNASTNEAIAFDFLYFRFIKPDGLHDYLGKLAGVTLRPL